MKNTVLFFALAMVVFAAACSQTTTNTNSEMNHNAMNHGNMNHGNMNHISMPTNDDGKFARDGGPRKQTDMMQSDPNAASAPYDLQFIDTMTHHHEGAIHMSELALKKSQNDELKKFAQKIIADQQKEISQMKEWREKWYAGKAPAKNMEMAGMADSMKMMSGGEMQKMEATSGKDFDLMFLEMMITHHRGAVEMAKEAVNKAEHAEIKTLANEIIKAQEAEIKQMTDWKTQWAK